MSVRAVQSAAARQRPPMPSRRAANVLEVVWSGTGATRYGSTDARWQRRVAYDAAEKHLRVGETVIYYDGINAGKLESIS